MRSDLRDLMSTTAAQPARPVDVDGIRRSVRRRRTVRRLVTAVASGAVVTLGVVAVPALVPDNRDVVIPVTSGSMSTTTPVTAPAPTAVPTAEESLDTTTPTVTVEVSEQDRALAVAFAVFAADPAAGPVGFRFSDEMALGLGEDILRTVPAESLVDPVAWELGVDDGFRERGGPFSAVDVLATAGPPDQLSVLPAPHKSCASPPLAVPPGLAELRHISIQPSGIDSCIDWFAVDLFIDADGNVAGVTLDLGSP